MMPGAYDCASSASCRGASSNDPMNRSYYAVCWKDDGALVNTNAFGVWIFARLKDAVAEREIELPGLQDQTELRRVRLTFSDYPISANGRAILKPGQEWTPT